MPQEKIIIRGAREHNLKNINVDIPRDKLVVITGLSGSGKSSLAFDTIFAEGQRRYVESLSAYARMFLGRMEKPDLDQIDGLSPAVSIDQKGVSRNPRSTVGTVTEIYDYLRLLFARVGIPHCPECGREVIRQSAQQIVESVETMPEGSRIQVLAPVIKAKKGHHQRVFEDVQKLGFVRVRVNGEVHDIDDDFDLERYKRHDIEVVIDRLVVHHYEDPEGEEARNDRSRLTDSIETALELGDGVAIINKPDSGEDTLFSEQLFCPHCSISLPEIEPRTFSFNSPNGACPECQGLGVKMEIDPDLIVTDKSQTLEEGPFTSPGWNTWDDNSWGRQMMEALSKTFNFRMDVPWSDLPEEAKQIILYGTGDQKIKIDYINKEGHEFHYQTRYEGVIPGMERRYSETSSDYMKGVYEGFMVESPCPVCEGRRLSPVSLAVTIGSNNVHEITLLPVRQLFDWVKSLRGNGSPAILSERDLLIGAQVLKEIEARLGFMVNVGLEYLSLSRSAGSLSGGEGQRIRLATQIGSQLMGVLYVLDEPSIGLHPRDNLRLIETLESMRDLGNTLLVVEHDEETMRHADWILDLGPGAGEHGGYVVAEGTVEDIIANPASITGAYLSGRRSIPIPDRRRTGNGRQLLVEGASENNLKGIDVAIPLGCMTCITGVSGSGKSTLTLEILYKALSRDLHGSRQRPGAYRAMHGVEHLDKIINIDQSPIGRTPRSNPATYTKMFDPIRDLFAELPESKIRGYKSGRFSFNIKGGRCEACQGNGVIEVEMQFLPDVMIPCEVCGGKRYNRETLQVKFKGHSIADILDFTVSEAKKVFENFPSIVNKLQTLDSVGLGYIRLGQAATTLSGGEAQRIKLSRELARRSTGKTVYVLDEPSVGLHAEDVSKLIEVLQELVNQGNTVIIIEHNLDIIKIADHLIDLGPEGGDAGGWIVAEGTPEHVASIPGSYTGMYLKEVLDRMR